MMEKYILWQGKTMEIEPLGFGTRLAWFDCEYDSGLLLIEKPHMLVLNSDALVPWQEGQGFHLYLHKIDNDDNYLPEGNEIILYEGVVIEEELVDYPIPIISFELTYSGDIISKMEDEVTRITLEKNAVFPGQVGDKFRLVLSMEE